MFFRILTFLFVWEWGWVTTKIGNECKTVAGPAHHLRQHQRVDKLEITAIIKSYSNSFISSSPHCQGHQISNFQDLLNQEEIVNILYIWHYFIINMLKFNSASVISLLVSCQSIAMSVQVWRKDITVHYIKYQVKSTYLNVH